MYDVLYLVWKRVMLHGDVSLCEGIHHCSHEVSLANYQLTHGKFSGILIGKASILSWQIF